MYVSGAAGTTSSSPRPADVADCKSNGSGIESPNASHQFGDRTFSPPHLFVMENLLQPMRAVIRNETGPCQGGPQPGAECGATRTVRRRTCVCGAHRGAHISAQPVSAASKTRSARRMPHDRHRRAAATFHTQPARRPDAARGVLADQPDTGEPEIACTASAARPTATSPISRPLATWPNSSITNCVLTPLLPCLPDALDLLSRAAEGRSRRGHERQLGAESGRPADRRSPRSSSTSTASTSPTTAAPIRGRQGSL